MMYIKQYPIIYFKIKTMLKLNKYKESQQIMIFFMKTSNFTKKNFFGHGLMRP